MVSTCTFMGKVEFRSSKGGDNIVTGESELFRINPKRVDLLLAHTGWSRLEPGSLNLGVEPSIIDQLGQLQELYFEKPDLIKYPDGTSRIPLLRGGYLYYRAVLRALDGEQQVLIRRAKVTPLTRRVEVYADVSLKKTFSLKERDEIKITVADKSHNLWIAD